MSKTVRFVFCVHLHQPVDNYEHVMQRIFAECYGPFLDAMERHPSITFNLHVSGPLFEWLAEHQPDYLVRLKREVDGGRLELLGGGYYEPILTMLPSEDAVGQLEMMREYLRATFEVEPAGAWLAERVWEPQLTSWLVTSGARYTVLDDTHFLAAGLSEDRLDAPYLTEDRGRLLTLFPLREPLRYAIPFKDPAWTIRYLKERARDDGKAVVVYADDGEKFGAWPGTYKHVYAGGWLENFLKALEAERETIVTSTFGQAMEGVRPAGRIYLPSCSYREMGEWSLMPAGQGEFRRLKRELEKSDQWSRAVRHFTGGQWRNFRAKYRESNLMYARMLGISRRLSALGSRSQTRRAALRSLFKGQCNCGYWHGVFGGLYLSHLRSSIYTHLLQAERHVENDPKASTRYPASRVEDYDLDGEDDVRLFNPAVSLFISPRHGGEIFEMDVRARDLNLLATMARYREAYHEDLPGASVKGASDVETIHGAPKAAQEGLAAHLKYDPYHRGALIDHFYAPDASLAAIESHEAERGDFTTRRYDFRLSRKSGRLAATMEAEGTAGGVNVRVVKEVRVDREEPGYQVDYVVENVGAAPLSTRFGIEFNVALMSPTEPGAFFHGGDQASLGDLKTRDARDVEREWWIRDNVHALDIGWILTRPCRLVTYPVQTVSASERGFELTYQGTVVMPMWDLVLEPGRSWNVVITHRAMDRSESKVVKKV